MLAHLRLRISSTALMSVSLIFALTISPAMAKSRGYLTTPQELARIRTQAEAGVEPYRSAVQQVLDFASESQLPAPDTGLVSCSASRTPVYITKGGPIAYAYALAYQLTGDSRYAERTHEAINQLRLITGLEAGDCPLTMGRHIPNWIRAADLIEDYWKPEDKRLFQNWLARVIYPSLLTKDLRANNWGAMITNAGQYIADYCHDRPDLKFNGQSAAQAYKLMRQAALDRMNGLIWDRCGEGVSMIRPDGGIPEELRRSTSCSDTALKKDSAAHHYSEGHLSGLLSQAELCRRRGDSSLFDNIALSAGVTAGGKELPSGRGSIRHAIDFILDRVPWERKQSLMIAARYYQDKRMLMSAREGRPHDVTHDDVNPFTTLTEDYSNGEKPGAPPVTPSPQ